MNTFVIIVTYNGVRWIDKCIGSVVTSSTKAIPVIVDNGSTDGTIECIKTKYPSAVLIESGYNLGFGKANNIGIKFALENNADYIYLLNQDAWLLPDTLEIMIEAHLAHPEYGVLSPIQMQANMQHIDRNFLLRLCDLGGGVIESLILGKKDSVLEIDMTMAAHWLISRECIERVGGFSPAFPHYCEDDNYADRVVYHGLKNGIALQAKAIHDREDRVKTNRQKIYDNYINTIMNVSYLVKQRPHALVSFYYHCIKDVVVYKSFLPIKYCIILTKSLKSIYSYKERSKEKKAFI